MSRALRLFAMYSLLLVATMSTTTMTGSATSVHDNNWAVIVSTSAFWFNYRHAGNALSFYHVVKSQGIPDDHIILMLADDAACNARNPFPGTVFASSHHSNMYGLDVEVDYRGADVTADNFLRVLTGRHEPHVPESKRMRTDERSNVLVYLTGHGGDGFLKFQDMHLVEDQEIADTIEEMKQRGRFNEMLFVADTCQAETLLQRLSTPGVVGIASSKLGENSYAYITDMEVGQALMDRFSHFSKLFFQRQRAMTRGTLGQWFENVRTKHLMSTTVLNSEHFARDVAGVPLLDFFGRTPAAAKIIPTDISESYDLFGSRTSSANPSQIPSIGEARLPHGVREVRDTSPPFAFFYDDVRSAVASPASLVCAVLGCVLALLLGVS